MGYTPKKRVELKKIDYKEPNMGARESMFQESISKVISDARMEFNKKLEKYLLSNLESIGYAFNNRTETERFFKNRITRLSNQDTRECEYWLDYGSKKETIIGLTDELKMSSRYEGNKFIFSIG